MPIHTLRTQYVCRECGYNPPKWVGQCPRCEAWNTIEESQVTKSQRSASSLRPGNGSHSLQPELEPLRLADVPGTTAPRLATSLSELDRVLGGGFVPGSTVLLGGDPGIGKSTLLLQAAASLAQRAGATVYATGEESPDQIKLRADRLSVPQHDLFIVPSGDVLGLAALLREMHPALLVVDSIQTAWHSGVDGSPGSLAQVRESAAELCSVARQSGTAIIFAGHVTKEGSIAGPKVLEHVVDVVLHMEGDSGTPLRLLRGMKNRYGATEELGVFEMRGDGLAGVDEPSAIFLSQRQPGASGSAVTTVIEGTRPLTIEVQALVTPSSAAAPRRVSNGYDLARLHLLVAVLSKRLRLPLGSQDVVVNIAGGLKTKEPSADLAVALAIVSSFLDVPVLEGLSACGEIGLGGELRGVHQAGRRVAESRRLGFDTCLIPAGSADLGQNEAGAQRVRSLTEAVQAAVPIRSGDS